MIDKVKIILRNKKKQYKYIKEYNFFESISNVLDFECIINSKVSDIKSICFVIPGMLAYSGGHTSILRLGTELANLGYEIRYVTYRNERKEDMVKNALINLPTYKGEIYEKDELFKLKNDIVVATLWESVYYVKKMNGYKMYFVQDYEPYFYNYGEKYLLAKQSYKLGLHMVSLGAWNSYMIERECNEKCDFIDFPYEKNEYAKVERAFNTYSDKNIIKLAVYVKSEEKRAPFIIQSILGKLKIEFENKNIKLEVYYFGEDKNLSLKNGTNLGKLNKDQLFELYKKCDFGMVASLTNISLVPYEMIASNLPIIEFEEGTFKFFFEEDSAILTSFDYKELSDKLYNMIKNPKKIENMTEKAYSQIKNLSWEKSAKQFESIMKK